MVLRQVFWKTFVLTFWIPHMTWVNQAAVHTWLSFIYKRLFGTYRSWCVCECVRRSSSGLKLGEFFERSELELSTLISVNSVVQQHFFWAQIINHFFTWKDSQSLDLFQGNLYFSKNKLSSRRDWAWTKHCSQKKRWPLSIQTQG